MQAWIWTIIVGVVGVIACAVIWYLKERQIDELQNETNELRWTQGTAIPLSSLRKKTCSYKVLATIPSRSRCVVQEIDGLTSGDPVFVRLELTDFLSPNDYDAVLEKAKGFKFWHHADNPGRSYAVLA